MKKWIIFIILCLITTYAFSSQFTIGNHEVESDLIVHNTTTDNPVLQVDSGNHRVGINASEPTAEFDVSGKFTVAASQVTVVNNDFVLISTRGSKYYWDKNGEIFASTFTVEPTSTVACNATFLGKIYYDSDDNTFYGCNNAGWQAFH